MTLRGVDPLRLPFPDFLAVIYAWLVEGASPEGREKFNTLLFKPPPGIRAEVMATLPEWQPEAMGDQFMAQMAARQARG